MLFYINILWIYPIAYWCSLQDEMKSNCCIFIWNSVANFALNWACNECITAKRGNKTYYRLEMNHCNDKSFCKMQYFLCYCFALSFAENQLLYSFSLLLLLVIPMLIFTLYLVCIWKAVWNLRLKLNWWYCPVAFTFYPFLSSGDLKNS